MSLSRCPVRGTSRDVLRRKRSLGGGGGGDWRGLSRYSSSFLQKDKIKAVMPVGLFPGAGRWWVNGVSVYQSELERVCAGERALKTLGTPKY